MAKKRTTRKRTASNKKGIKFDVPTIANGIGVLLSFFGIFNFGFIGIFIGNVSQYFFGNLYQLVLLLYIVAAAYFLLYQRQIKIQGRFIVALILVFLSVFTIDTLFFANTVNASQNTQLINNVLDRVVAGFKEGKPASGTGGGVFGAILFSAIKSLFGNIGVWIISIISFVSGIVIAFRIPVRDYSQKAVNAGVSGVENVKNNLQERRQQSNDELQNGRKDFSMPTELSSANSENNSSTNNAKTAQEDNFLDIPQKVAPKIHWQNPQETQTGSSKMTPTSFDQPLTEEQQVQAELAQSTSRFASQFDEAESENETKNVEVNEGIEVSDIPNYRLPTYELLTPIAATDQTQERSKLEEKSQLVHDTLKSFNIDVEVTDVRLGPTVTQYELKPAVGVKVSRIASLSDDLAMALSAKSIRIQAPIPGRPLVGIEVPNEVQATVSFRDMIEHSKTFVKNKLTVPLGRNVSGDIVSADLTAMPHLLIAGSTGSGKSVAINGIISSILTQAKPSEVRMLMIDPKKVELSVYNDIPHLLSPVVSEPRKAAKALQKVVVEMERRYELFAEVGVRNIAGYNEKVEQNNLSTENTAMTKMPFIVSIVDELADLMMTVSGDVEPAIIRIAQMGRAAGIHLILATQRPSVDVITGLIKANVPSRIAFAVSSGIDSRTILDQNGAEKLLGKGDMLFAPIGKQPERVQGAFVSDNDVENITNFIRNQQTATYSASITVTDADMEGSDDTGLASNGGTSKDALYKEVLQLVIETQKASTSYIQRRFGVGYSRAARLMDDLEAAGIISPQNGSKPRDVLVKSEQEITNQ